MSIYDKIRQCVHQRRREANIDYSSFFVQEEGPEGAFKLSEPDSEEYELRRKTVPEEEVCVICFDFRKVIRFKPCKHLCCCQHCAKALTESTSLCPLCRAKIIDFDLEEEKIEIDNEAIGKRVDQKNLLSVERSMKLIEQFANKKVLNELMNMGFSKLISLKAIRNTGNGHINNAVEWVLKHMDDPDIEDPIRLNKTDEEIIVGMPVSVRTMSFNDFENIFNDILDDELEKVESSNIESTVEEKERKKIETIKEYEMIKKDILDEKPVIEKQENNEIIIEKGNKGNTSEDDSIDKDNIDHLIGLGYSKEESLLALKKSKDNLEEAIYQLEN